MIQYAVYVMIAVVSAHVFLNILFHESFTGKKSDKLGNTDNAINTQLQEESACRMPKICL